MYGGSQKAGRGGGGGRGKRGGYSSLGTPNRPASGGGGSRLSTGGSAARGRNPSATKPTAPAAVDETFTLVPGDRQLSFAATLRLPPDLLDEIKRVESQGGVAQVKFDSNPINGPGNVIDVGGKEFRFTWSREVGDLCDIYEERPDGEDGSCLLVESGCAWRKLNVQRTLDESTKNHLKMRSEEAERKSRARKTVILDPGNPSMKSQIKALAAADASPWKSFAQKKEPPSKKQKFESSQVGGLPKVVHKSGFPSINSPRGKLSTSSMPSPPGQQISSASPSAMGNVGKSRGITSFGTPSHGPKDESNFKHEKDVHEKASSGILDTLSRMERENAVPTDLQSTLINVLKDKPSGMSLKALEMAVRDIFPGSPPKIEPTLKKIATSKTPGRYILNSEIELEGSKRTSPSEIPPEANGNKSSLPEENHSDMLSLAQKSSRGIFEHEATFNSIFGEDHDSDEKMESPRHSPDPIGDKNSDRQVGGNSRSDSDSDSDSRSNSGSLAGTGSGSSSDSDSDSAPNSKEGSDVDVDILGDDEEEARDTLQAPDPNLSSSPLPWTSFDEKPLENGLIQRANELGSEDVVIDKDMNIDDDDDIDVGTAMDLIPDADLKPVDDFQSTSPIHEEHWNANRNETVSTSSGAFGHGDSDRSYKSRTKKGPFGPHDEENTGLLRTLEVENPVQSPVSRYEGSNLYLGPQRMPSDRPVKDSHKRMDRRYSKDDIIDPALQRDYGHPPRGGSVLESQQLDKRPLPSVGSRHHLTDDRSGTQSHVMANQDKSILLQENQIKQKDGVHKDEDGTSYSKTKKSRYSAHSNKCHQSKLNEQGSNHHVDPIMSSPKVAERADVSKLCRGTGRNRVLHRELSEPELGELREPSSEEPDGLRKRFDRKDSFKNLETDVGSVDVTVNANHIGGSCLDPDKTSSSKKELLTSSSSDIKCNNVAVGNNGTGLEGYGETHKKSHVNKPIKESKQVRASNSRKGSKSQKSIVLAQGVDNFQATPSMEGANLSQKRSESSSDESSCFFKYEKEEPDLKGAIKNFNQYKEYVQEYREKYNIYGSLNTILENYRHKFYNLGKELDSTKGRDPAKYQKILRQLRESYFQDGEKHKRLKKIFVVLHEELKQLKQRVKDFAVSYTQE